ncbi:hypothetical protein E3A20_12700, partial [Planctomyces bekefii]
SGRHKRLDVYMKTDRLRNTPRGAEASAIIYSVVEAMKMNKKIPLNELVRPIRMATSKKSESLSIDEIMTG